MNRYQIGVDFGKTADEIALVVFDSETGLVIDPDRFRLHWWWNATPAERAAYARRRFVFGRGTGR